MRINDQEANRLRVLKMIRREEPVARTDLIRLTGLGNATISEIVGDLVRRKILLEMKRAAVGRGRPRVQLVLNPDAYHVLSAFLLPEGALNIEISNARGDSLFSRTSAISRAPTVEALAEDIAVRLEEAIALSPFDKAIITRVGVALPAIVDSVGGIVHLLETYPAHPTPFAAIIQERVRLPVTIDNNVNVMARAEHWFGDDRQVDDFSLFVIGMTLGFSQYVDGVLRTGAHGMNAEFAHVKVAFEGPPCVCGARGCLGALASGYGIILRICERRGRPAPDFSDLPSALQDFAAEAQGGEPIAAEAFEFAGRLLGAAVASHINMTDPARVRVLALDAALAELIVEPFYAAVRENTLPVFRGRTPVQFTAAPEVGFSHGAAAIVLERLYRVCEERTLLSEPA
jgi:predicted NBD/HSP70 family sugar kinase